MNHIPLCIYYTVLIHSSVERLCCFHLLATVNNASMNMGYEYPVLGFKYFGCFPWTGIDGFCVNSVFVFEEPPTVFCSCGSILLYSFIRQSNTSYGWIYLILLIHSPVGGHFQCFYLGLLRTVLLWILVYNFIFEQLF